MKKGIFLKFVFLGISFPLIASAWDLNDVSYLLPLPNSQNVNRLLKPSTSGAFGELLPTKYLSLLPLLDQTSTQENLIANLAVVGIRIDPCFVFAVNDSTCHHQIRMVLQSLRNDGNTFEARDAAVHTFYDLPAEEFARLLSELSQLATSNAISSTASVPLQVHPVIKTQGLDGKFWKDLKTIILSHTGAARLVRFTFTSLEIPEGMWDFGGFDISSQRTTRLEIPRVGTRQQSFINSGAGDGFKGGARPQVPSETDVLTHVTSDSSAPDIDDPEKLRMTSEAAHRIENPTIHSPATIDCVSCHATQGTLNWMTKSFPALTLDQSEFKFKSTLNLTNETAPDFTGKVIRAFGYFGNRPAIGQRVINESAAIAEKLNK